MKNPLLLRLSFYLQYPTATGTHAPTQSIQRLQGSRAPMGHVLSCRGCQGVLAVTTQLWTAPRQCERVHFQNHLLVTQRTTWALRTVSCCRAQGRCACRVQNQSPAGRKKTGEETGKASLHLEQETPAWQNIRKICEGGQRSSV